LKPKGETVFRVEKAQCPCAGEGRTFFYGQATCPIGQSLRGTGAPPIGHTFVGANPKVGIAQQIAGRFHPLPPPFLQTQNAHHQQQQPPHFATPPAMAKLWQRHGAMTAV
jgi:hypothetical protein